MKLNSADFERTGKNEQYDNCVGSFCSFYNEEADETMIVWHRPDGAMKLLDEDMMHEYDADDLNIDEEIDNCHELMAIL